jgi:DNA-directed RNA polymerase III subunit RPC8
VYDVLECQNGKVTWGNGQVYYKGNSYCQLTGPQLTFPAVTFRLVVFAPFTGEVVVGRVMTCTPQYVRGMLLKNICERARTDMESYARVLQ